MFLTDSEIKLSEKFISNGYVIKPLANKKAFEEIENIFLKNIESNLNLKISNLTNWLNNTHENITKENLNDFRLKVIFGINNNKDFRKFFFNISRPYLETLVGNELVMQMKINLSIQLPFDESSLLPVHADTWSGDSAFEVVVWLPLVDCFETKSMYILPPKENKYFHENFSSANFGDSESLFKRIENKVEWINIKKGEVLIFNQALPHGNRVNKERETRWSMNCRFKSVFSPYSDKKLGEFFEPITLRAASKLGMDYKLPKIN